MQNALTAVNGSSPSDDNPPHANTLNPLLLGCCRPHGKGFSAPRIGTASPANCCFVACCTPSPQALACSAQWCWCLASRMRTSTGLRRESHQIRHSSPAKTVCLREYNTGCLLLPSLRSAASERAPVSRQQACACDRVCQNVCGHSKFNKINVTAPPRTGP